MHHFKTSLALAIIGTLAPSAFAHMKNLTVEGLRVDIGDEGFKAVPRFALALFSVDGAQISKVTRNPAAGTPPIIEQTDCKQVRISETKNP